MLFDIPEESRFFMRLTGKALQGKLTPVERGQFEELLKKYPEMKRQFYDLAAEVENAKLSEIWEHGLRVLLRCPQPGDSTYLESLNQSDPGAWRAFVRGAFALLVMAESISNASKPIFDNKLTADEERHLLTAVRDAQEKTKRRR